ncbi:GH25 family lysozyme [Nonomuraea sp. LP-02]|uniref:GH25 family lysozyme n=1 Tax=Nonomuraea sp. LP-02 TaxID=3097960 RepID=UPI002E31F60B|nr:GH25 family lysozyme [Nonomuraea sp. LP-02]MED7927973.1 GH25 family lysozyme [Nonomuraea sp. LP-02]
MKRLGLLAVIAVSGIMGSCATAYAADGVPGVDVSNWTGEIDWANVAEGGGKFAFVQLTEGTNVRNPIFDAQFGGAASASLYRGAYHFAQPHESDGATQADFFLQNGGDWIADGRTLPGVLDVEDNPYRDKNGKNSCYDLSAKDMVAWLKAFTKRYKQRTGLQAIIYTTTSWWRTCTGDSAAFAAHPLWLARWGADPGELPKSWTSHTFWQSAEKGPLAGGGDVFNGTEDELKALANPPAEISVAAAAKSRKAYTVTLRNTGPYPVTNVKIAARTFGGQRVVGAPDGCRVSGTAVRCTVAEVARGSKVTLTFTTKPRRAKGTVGMNVTVGTTKFTIKVR